jgi:hypothetical protein
MQDVYEHHYVERGVFVGDPLTIEPSHRNQCLLPYQDIDSFQAHIGA